MSKDNRFKINLLEVAKAAGVSKMTASRVLRNASGFSQATRERVLREVERLGYVPNRIAATFGSDETSTIIGVSAPYLSSSLFGAVLDATNLALAKFGYQTMIGSHENRPETEEMWVRNILSWRPAGLILSAHQHTRATRELIKQHGIPVAEIWNLNTSPLDLSIGFNHADCGFEMGQYVLGRGHTRIGYVGADADAPGPGALRRQGFEAALATAGLKFAAVEVLNDRPGFYPGFYGTETLLNRAKALDCVYYQDDAMAIGGYYYCKSQGLSIPSDIGIAGWGNIEAASVLPQRLTTTIISTEALGRAAAIALIKRIRGEPVDDVTFTPTRLAPGNTV